VRHAPRRNRLTNPSRVRDFLTGRASWQQRLGVCEDRKVQAVSTPGQAHDSHTEVHSELPEPTIESPVYGRPDEIDTVSPGLLDESGAVQSIVVNTDSNPSVRCTRLQLVRDRQLR
jgi:hypothetical protein